jgi:hypothetical protein
LDSKILGLYNILYNYLIIFRLCRIWRPHSGHYDISGATCSSETSTDFQ